jgi:hypothetical protein
MGNFIIPTFLCVGMILIDKMSYSIVLVFYMMVITLHIPTITLFSIHKFLFIILN